MAQSPSYKMETVQLLPWNILKINNFKSHEVLGDPGGGGCIGTLRHTGSLSLASRKVRMILSQQWKEEEKQGHALA